jgi:hypothetical protein
MPGRGRLLDHLLVAPLERAVALEQMHRARAVAEDLHLDMARLLHVFFYKNRVVAEGRRGLPPGARQRVHEIRRRGDLAHPLAAAAGHGLDEHRVADGVRRTRQMLRLLVLAVIARHDRHARLGHQRLGRVLQPHRADRGGGRPDEDEARGLHRLHEVRVLAQKAVARMDRLRPRRPRRVDDRRTPQVAVGRFRAADIHTASSAIATCRAARSASE